MCLYDRGHAIEPENQQWLDIYKRVAAGKRTIVRSGDEIPVKGVKVQVVSSNGEVLAKPINGAGRGNPLCADAERKAPAARENQRGVGALVSYGTFSFLDLIDLDWEREMALS